MWRRDPGAWQREPRNIQKLRAGNEFPFYKDQYGHTSHTLGGWCFKLENTLEGYFNDNQATYDKASNFVTGYIVRGKGEMEKSQMMVTGHTGGKYIP